MSQFFSPSSGIVTDQELITLIAEFVYEKPTSFYRLVIGTDSQIKHSNGKSEIDYVTAVIIYRQGAGALYFLHKEKVQKKPILRDKIYTETVKSLQTAESLVPQLRTILAQSQYDLEIHIDVGHVGKTRDMIKEVVGMVSGSGYVARTKPDSWGASSVADKHT
jgi:predicted RNase H-related nuclease YkuK (DUF458 family)